MQPIDYTLQVQQPFAAAVQGFQLGNAIQQQQAEQARIEQQRQAQAQMQSDLAGLAANRNATAADYASMMTRYPQLSEQLKRASDAMSGEQQQSFIRNASPILAALQNQRPDVAEKLLRDSATAKRASGMEAEAKQDEMLADLTKLNPDIARSGIALRISGMPGGDRVIDSITKLGQEDRAAKAAPAELRKKEADATTAEVTAKYADKNALLDLEQKGWNIKQLQADIDYKKQSLRIQAMQASIAQADSETRRKELQIKLDDAITARDAKLREKVATAENGAAAIDNMLNTIERVKKAPGLDNVLGSIEGRLPSFFKDDNVDAEALVDTLGSQAFLAQLPAIKGTGQLSNAEGDKLQSALQNLGRKQSEKQFRENLDEASRLLNKAREGLTKSTGVPLGKPDTPAAPGARPPLSSFAKP